MQQKEEPVFDQSQQVDQISPQKKKYWKFWLTMFFLNLGLLVVIYKLLMIQVVNVEEYHVKAKKQHQSKINLSAERGNIYDRYNKLIASNIESVSIAVDPRHLQNKKKVIEIISKNYGVPASKLNTKITNSKSAFVWIIRGVDPTLSKELEALNDKGVILINEPKRIYHYGGIAAQIVGFCDIDNKGLSGIELKWDTLLKGKPGYMIVNRDGLGKLRQAADLPVIPAQHGHSIKLTLDIELQRIVENELRTGVINSGAESGTLVAIEPETGDILAMASYPGYDPEDISRHSPSSMRTRAITDVLEPGSTFKVITAAAAMEEKIVSENDIYNGYGGTLQFKEYTIRDVHGYGMITFKKAMEVSSNVVLSTVASKIPDNTFYKYIRDFGFGLEYGIEIPGEVSGRLRKRDDFSATAKRYIGFGYGISATSLQMANAYSTIANGGELMKPYLVKSVFREDTGEEFYSAKPIRIRRVISDSTAKRLTSILESIVQNGTGKAAIVDGMKIAGKTGTAQQLVDGKYSKSNYNASFAGYFPADNPKLAMIIVIDKPRASIYGGATAAPIFKNIALRWSAINSHIYERDSIQSDTLSVTVKDSVLVPQLVGLNTKTAINFCNAKGLNLKIKPDDKIIISQNPTAFSRVRKGTIVSVIASLPTDSTAGKPNIIGLSIRQALNVISKIQYNPIVIGSGIVKSVKWNPEGKSKSCIIYCN